MERELGDQVVRAGIILKWAEEIKRNWTGLIWIITGTTKHGNESESLSSSSSLSERGVVGAVMLRRFISMGSSKSSFDSPVPLGYMKYVPSNRLCPFTQNASSHLRISTP
jgi:hypothetical protein